MVRQSGKAASLANVRIGKRRMFACRLARRCRSSLKALKSKKIRNGHS